MLTHSGGDFARLSPVESKACGSRVINNFIHNDSFGTHSQQQLSEHGLLLAAGAVEQYAVLRKQLDALWTDYNASSYPQELLRPAGVGQISDLQMLRR